MDSNDSSIIVLEGGLGAFSSQKTCKALMNRSSTLFERNFPLIVPIVLLLCVLLIQPVFRLLEVPYQAKYGLVMIFGGTALVVWQGLKRRRAIWGSIDAAPIRKGQQSFELSPSGLVVNGQVSSHRYQWDAFIGIEIVEDGLALLLGPLEYQPIPRSAFATESEMTETAERIREWIGAANTGVGR